MMVDPNTGLPMSIKELNRKLDANASEIEHQQEFGVEYEFNGGKWGGVSIWARDWDEASEKLQALKRSAVIIGLMGEKKSFRDLENG